MENGLRRPSFLRVLVALAAVVVVLVGMRLAAPILNPILFAVVLALLFGPLYSWLRRRGLPAPLALVIPAQRAIESLARELGLDPDARPGLRKVTQTD